MGVHRILSRALNTLSYSQRQQIRSFPGALALQGCEGQGPCKGRRQNVPDGGVNVYQSG